MRIVDDREVDRQRKRLSEYRSDAWASRELAFLAEEGDERDM